MKGINIVVKGSVGHMSAFMAQKGNLVIMGDADADLGDSIYEAKIFVKGKVKSLGADCVGPSRIWGNDSHPTGIPSHRQHKIFPTPQTGPLNPELI